MVVSVRGNEFDKEYIDLILKDAYNVNEKNLPSQTEESSRASAFKCVVTANTNGRPTSVHKVRPADIEVIGAIGDSLTAANGAKASTILGLLEECRGVAWK